jgi:hypothetical protein
MFMNARQTLSLAWILSVLFAVSAFFAIVCTALVILPRSKAGGASLYWGAWTDPDAIGQRFAAEIPDEFIKSEYLQNVKNLAHICQIKYHYVGLAFRAAALAILCYILIMLMS